jgi:hypothetical protein
MANNQVKSKDQENRRKNTRKVKEEKVKAKVVRINAKPNEVKDKAKEEKFKYKAKANAVRINAKPNEVKERAKANAVRINAKLNEVKEKAKANAVRINAKPNEVKEKAKANAVRINSKLNEVKEKAKANAVRINAKPNEVKEKAKANEVRINAKPNEVKEKAKANAVLINAKENAKQANTSKNNEAHANSQFNVKTKNELTMVNKNLQQTKAQANTSKNNEALINSPNEAKLNVSKQANSQFKVKTKNELTMVHKNLQQTKAQANTSKNNEVRINSPNEAQLNVSKQAKSTATQVDTTEVAFKSDKYGKNVTLGTEEDANYISTIRVRDKTIKDNPEKFQEKHGIFRRKNIDRFSKKMHIIDTNIKYVRREKLSPVVCATTMKQLYDSVDANGYKNIFPSVEIVYGSKNIQLDVHVSHNAEGGSNSEHMLVFMSNDTFGGMPYNIQLAYMYYAVHMFARFMGDVAYHISSFPDQNLTNSNMVSELVDVFNTAMRETADISTKSTLNNNHPMFINKKECISNIQDEIRNLDTVQSFKGIKVELTDNTLNKLNLDTVEKCYEPLIVAAIVMTFLNASIKLLNVEDVINRLNGTILNTENELKESPQIANTPI